jgi:hypothetical protein
LQFGNINLGQKKFSVIKFQEPHEVTGQRGATLDKDLADFMEMLMKNHPNMALIVLGDHGINQGGWISIEQPSEQERFLPMLSLFLPNE